VGDIERGLDDVSILEQAYSEGRVLITNDKDFGELVYRKRNPHQGVVLLRLRLDSASNRVDVLKKLIQLHESEIAAKFVVATETQVRIRE